MIKIISPDSQTFDVPTMEMVKMSNRGLRGDDLRSFVKRAGHEFADKLRDVHVAPGEQLVHLIAIGSTEAYGPNRNGDGFKSATCRKYHPTFVKHARWYRNHQNKDESKSYGIIKMSAFNEAMKRIELLVALNGTKEAADRNKGLVADKEMQKIASGSGDWGVSMACRVPFDVCSGCGNKAPSRAQYCKEASCKYGGCYDNLTKVAEDGHVLHVDNPDPTWFDISDVYRPADRIAYVFGHMKAASHGGVGGALMAEELGLTAPYRLNFDNFDDRSMELIKLAYEMVDLEAALETGKLGNSTKDAVILNDKTASLNGIPAGRLTMNQIWRALSREKVALSVKDWLDVLKSDSDSLTLKTASAEEVERCLPGVFSRLIADNLSLEHCISERTCDPSLAFPSEKIQDWATKLAGAKSINPAHFERRVVRQVVGGSEKRASFSVKKASQSQEAEQLARRYATYQLYFLNELKNDSNFGWYKEHAVRSNYLA
jgi:hypothetical protein